MVKLLLAGLLLFLLIERLLELKRAERNRKKIIQQGGSEWGASHYPLFFILHGAWFFCWPFEAILRGFKLNPWWFFWLGIFISADALRYWCMYLLGSLWNTRIVVLPGVSPVRKGPYKWFSHPIYFAVSLILLAVPLIFEAVITAVVISMANILLLVFVRIPQEKAALKTLR